MQREHLGSRLGFILLSAGCAIGIGNVWKFPYMVGQYGGGAFVLIYLFFLLIFGVPVMTMEFSLGRAAQKSPVKLYQELEKPGSKWHLHGYVALAGNYLLMMFYTTVTGWMLYYFVNTAAGTFAGLDADGVKNAYNSMLGEPVEMSIYMLVVVAIGFLVCSIGVQRGLERITKWMMLALLSMPCVLGFNVWSGFKPFGGTSTIMDLEDFLVSNIMLPLGTLVFVLFCTTRYGWGWKNFTKEANEGRGLKVANWMRGYMTYVLPVIVLIIFVVGLVNMFG